MGFVLIVAVRHMDCQAADAKLWKPASYHGLVMGKSTDTDVRTVLGKPESTGKEEDTGDPILVYKTSDPAPGMLNVYIHKGILSSMDLQLSKSMSQRDLIRLLGNKYVIAHYSFDECLDDGEDGVPVYEDPNGQLTHIEYRDRGIWAPLDPGGSAEEIVFISKSLIPTHSLCKGSNKKK